MRRNKQEQLLCGRAVFERSTRSYCARASKRRCRTVAIVTARTVLNNRRRHRKAMVAMEIKNQKTTTKPRVRLERKAIAKTRRRTARRAAPVQEKRIQEQSQSPRRHNRVVPRRRRMADNSRAKVKIEQLTVVVKVVAVTTAVVRVTSTGRRTMAIMGMIRIIIVTVITHGRRATTKREGRDFLPILRRT